MASPAGFTFEYLSQQAIDAIPAAVFVTTVPGGNIVRSNRCAVEWCGRSVSSPQRLWELLRCREGGEEVHTSADDAIASALREGTRLIDAEARLSAGPGAIRVSVSIEPIRDSGGHPCASVTLCRRIPRWTERLPDLVFPSTRLGTWELDVESRVLTSSPLCKSIHGLSPDDDLQLESVILPAIHPEYRDTVRASVEKAIESGGAFETEVPYEWPDGSQHWLYIAGRLIDSSTLAGVSMDVTVRQHAVQALRDNERRYREIVDTANEGIWILDANAHVTFANRRMAELIGWPAAEIVGRQKWDFVFEQDIPVLKELLDEHRRGLTGEPADVRFRHRDGHEVWTLMAACPIWDDAGHFAGVLDLFTDITARKRAEQALREADRRFQVMADNSPVLIWQTDASGVVFVNRFYLDFFAQPMEKIAGMGWAAFLHPDDIGYLEAYRSAFDERQRYEYECRFCRGDGEYRWLRNAGLPYYGADGTFVGFIGCSFDVTDNRRAAAALIDADHRKDEFLALLGHELRGPLAPIFTAIRLLQLKGPKDPQLEKLRQTIHRQAVQLSKLVDDLLDVSRIASGKLQLKREVADLHAAVHLAIETCEPLIARHRHTLDVSLSPESVYLDIDVGRIVQVLCNLLTNAAKYMNDGGRIEVTTGVQQGMAVIAVRDQGIGIPTDMIQRIFDRFVQVDNSQQHGQGGLGIGLAIVKAIVEMHDGTVAVRSDGIGRGSEFTVRLPITAMPRS